MAGLKKSNVKKKSTRAVEMELAKQEELAKEQEAQRKKKEKANAQSSMMVDAMVGIYSILAVALSILFIHTTLSLICVVIALAVGIFGVIRLKERKDKMYYFSLVSVVLAALVAVYYLVLVILTILK